MPEEETQLQHVEACVYDVADARPQSSDNPVEIDIESMSLDQRISHIINKPEVVKLIREKGEIMLGLAIKFLILFEGQEQGLLTFLREYDHYDENTRTLITQTLARKLMISDTTLEESKRSIYEYFYEKFIKNGYYFHAFSGLFLSSIKKQGLDPNERLWDWEEIDEIIKVVRRRAPLSEELAEANFFGSLNRNCRGLTSIADNTARLYQYAVGSPEWFAIMTKHAYEQRDYEAARSNVEEKMDELRGLEVEERVKILAFFDKYWKLFTSEANKPRCALIRRGIIDREEEEDLTHEKVMERMECEGGDIYELIRQLFTGFEYNLQINQKIDPEDLRIIDLPERL